MKKTSLALSLLLLFASNAWAEEISFDCETTFTSNIDGTESDVLTYLDFDLERLTGTRSFYGDDPETGYETYSFAKVELNPHWLIALELADPSKAVLTNTEPRTIHYNETLRETVRISRISLGAFVSGWGMCKIVERKVRLTEDGERVELKDVRKF